MNSSNRSSNTLRLSGYCYPYGLRPALSIAGSPDFLRPSIAQTSWYRNINLLSIDYAFRPRLRVRLTPGGRTFPGKPWVFGGRNSHPACRYSCLHGHLYKLHLRSLIGFNAYTTLFYHHRITHYPMIRGFGYELQSRSSSARYHSTSELLRTL